MHLKLTLQRPQGRSTDIGVTVDATALVGDLAGALYSADPVRAGARAPEGMTLRVEDRTGRQSGTVLDPSRNLIEAGVRSGSVVSLERYSTGHAVEAGRTGPTAALLRIVDGPDQGKEFSLKVGVNHVGRHTSCDIQLRDPLVSKRHARIIVGDTIEVVDQNSVNGVLLGGRRVSRAIIGSADVMLIGDSAISITSTRMAGTAVPTSPVIEFNRSPRVVARFPEREFEMPDLPKLPQRQRFPWIALAAPLLMAGVLYSFTHNPLSLVFMGLMPLMAIGMWVDRKLDGNRQLKRQKEAFAANLAALARELDSAQQVERAVRGAQIPSVAETMTAINQLGTMLWTHRPEQDSFLTVRLGIGIAPSQCSVRVAQEKDALPEYRAKAAEFKRRYETVAPVPHIGDFRTAGVIGVAGPRGLVEGVARGLVMQLVGLHSPAELTLAVLASPLSRQTWEWAQWLPHVGSPYSPIRGGAHLADNQGTGSALLSELEDLVALRTDAGVAVARGAVDGLAGATVLAQHPLPHLPVVMVVVEDDTPIDRARLNRLAETGPDVGIHLLWVAAQQQSLPAACRTFVLLKDGAGNATVGQVRHGLHAYPAECESVDLASARAASLFLSPVVDTGRVVEDSSDLPQSISWLDLVGLEVAAQPSAVLERWREGGSIINREGPAVPRRKGGDLRAVIGSVGASGLTLDLREHGPHALVGGTTGSGKSEFLQTWVLAMAAAHSPDRITFLLVDYKGGAAFSDCTSLPHTVGLVTDLSPYLVRRALTSLRAELRFREHLLQRKRQKDLVSLERTGDPECPPSLVIVVDEFAALVKEIPEFVDGVVDVAQRGRSLGLHLILATQRPAGVIKDNLRANTNLRIALRMADNDDSTDVIGVPDAGAFPTNIPGRAAVKTGPGRLTTFQTGYVGGWTTPTPEAPAIEIREVRFGSDAPWEIPLEINGPETDQGPTDIHRAVETISQAAADAGIPTPRKPWLPVLSPSYDYRDLIMLSRSDNALLLGVGDEPELQQQPIRFWEPNTQGNLVIFGASGSGKSTALRQVAIAAAVSFRGGPVHCYGLDFGSAGLRLISDLPNVGAVISGEDEERLARLLRRLIDVIDERARLYSEMKASTITEYRERADRPDEPRIILLVDGIGAFREAYEHSIASPWFTLFSQIAADGRAVGVHVVMTADRAGGLPPSLSSSVGRRVVLRMASVDDYLTLGVPTDVLDGSSTPGRGILDGCEVQLAVLGGDSNLAIQARELASFADAMRRKGISAAPPVERLSSDFLLSSLPATAMLEGIARAVIGLRFDNLEPATISTSGTFMISGPPSSGRSTALAAMAESIARATPRRHRIFLSARPSSLSDSGHWTASAVGADKVAALVSELIEEFRTDHARAAGFAIFIEGVPGFHQSAADPKIVELVKTYSDAGLLVVGESEISSWSASYTLSPLFKGGRRGMLLMPNDMDGDTLLQTSLGRIKRAEFMPGRGFLIERGKATRLQVGKPSM